jgi:hypothetical protein
MGTLYKDKKEQKLKKNTSYTKGWVSKWHRVTCRYFGRQKSVEGSQWRNACKNLRGRHFQPWILNPTKQFIKHNGKIAFLEEQLLNKCYLIFVAVVLLLLFLAVMGFDLRALSVLPLQPWL